MKAHSGYVFSKAPLHLKLVSVILIVSFICLVLMSLPLNTFTKAMGVVEFQERANALRHALYWEARVIAHPDIKLEHRVLYGFVNSIDAEGRVDITFADLDEYKTAKYILADLKVINYGAIKSFFHQNKMNNFKFDLYGEMVVIHADATPLLLNSDLQRVPLNIQFIESGDAVPDPNPPTNIVDRAFAAHYWKLATKKK